MTVLHSAPATAQLLSIVQAPSPYSLLFISAMDTEMLSVYVKRLRRELLAILKHVDGLAWEAICNLDDSEQIAAIAKHPAIRECISYHLLSQAGFGPDSYVEHRRTRSVYIVSYAIISTDPEGNPFHVVLYGKPESASVTSSPGVIGRLEEFVSMTTGLNVLPGDLFNQVPRG